MLPSASSLRLPAPPDGNAEVDALRRIMAQRDSAGAAQVAYWNAGSPGYRWMQITTQELLKRNTPAPLATRALALVGAAIYDATIAAWDSKYAYNRPRPSDTDSSIQPLIDNPRTPSYPSEHAASAASASAVLAYLFPDEADAFTQMAQQAANSRLLAGTEFPSDSRGGTFHWTGDRRRGGAIRKGGRLGRGIPRQFPVRARPVEQRKSRSASRWNMAAVGAVIGFTASAAASSGLRFAIYGEPACLGEKPGTHARGQFHGVVLAAFILRAVGRHN
ncbi:MAG: phosphatase PAP2 family protein [Bryobacteraceae bacterium]